jgi:hypothetical protein
MLHDLKGKNIQMYFHVYAPIIISRCMVNIFKCPLTIPVNNMDTIPVRPRPSASMYLEWKFNIKLHQNLERGNMILNMKESEESSLRKIWKKDKKAAFQVLQTEKRMTYRF